MKSLVLFYALFGMRGLNTKMNSYLDMINNPVTAQQVNAGIAFRNLYSQLLYDTGGQDLIYHVRYENDKFVMLEDGFI